LIVSTKASVLVMKEYRIPTEKLAMIHELGASKFTDSKTEGTRNATKIAIYAMNLYPKMFPR
jgi:hypothetical protein